MPWPRDVTCMCAAPRSHGVVATQSHSIGCGLSSLLHHAPRNSQACRAQLHRCRRWSDMVRHCCVRRVRRAARNALCAQWSLLSGLYTWYCHKRDVHVLILGLDHAGKTVRAYFDARVATLWTLVDASGGADHAGADEGHVLPHAWHPHRQNPAHRGHESCVRHVGNALAARGMQLLTCSN